MGEGARRWRRLVRARRDEMERLRPGGGDLGAAFWDRLACRFSDNFHGADDDPLLRRAVRRVGRRTTVVDVGAGTGRLTVPLARRSGRVLAVDASRGMLEVLEQRIAAAGLDNVRSVHARWEDADDIRGDVAVCSYVIPLIADVGPFLARLGASAGRWAAVSMNGISADAELDPLWRRFHGRPRRPAPTYLDAAAVLSELGYQPRVELAEITARRRWAALDDAVQDLGERLMLPADGRADAELRATLPGWLVRDQRGLRPPLSRRVVAVLSWETGRR